MDEHLGRLRNAAIEAYLCGATETAERLFSAILKSHPATPEAEHARQYLAEGNLFWHLAKHIDGGSAVASDDFAWDATKLRQTALDAHANDDAVLAGALLRRIVMVHPGSPEAKYEIAYLAEHSLLVL